MRQISRFYSIDYAKIEGGVQTMLYHANIAKNMHTDKKMITLKAMYSICIDFSKTPYLHGTIQ